MKLVKSAAAFVWRRRLRVVLLLVVGVAIVLRVRILSSPIGRPNSDEAVVGLMALTMRHGHRVYMYWGQAYGGTLEPALTAFVFVFTGASATALKAVPSVLAGVSAVLCWRVARRVIGEPAAAFAGAALLVFPPFFVWMSTRATGYYWAALALVLAVTLCALRLFEQAEGDERCDRRDVAALGFLFGLAWWTSPQSMFVLGSLLVWLAIRAWRRWREVWPALLAFPLGAAPWLWWSAHSDWKSLSPPPAGSGYGERLLRFFTHALPEMLGARTPYVRAWQYGDFGIACYVAVLAALAVFVVRVARRPRDQRRAWEPIFVVVGVYPLLYAIPATSFFTGEPRYLTMLAPFALILFGAALGRVEAQLVALGVAIALALMTLHGLDRARGNPDMQGPDVGRLVAALDHLGVDRAYADYWIAYPIDFATELRIIATPVDNVREPAYDRLVAAKSPSAYVLFHGGKRDFAFAHALGQLAVGYRRTIVGRFVVYVLDRSFRPDQLPGAFWRTH